MSTARMVECGRCGKRVRLRRDGTYGTHYYLRSGTQVECQLSRTQHDPHVMQMRIVERGPDGRSRRWLGECACGSSHTAAAYDELYVWHDEHVEAERGVRR